ncbi:hypothetical protein [Marinobacter sp. PE14]
MNYSEPGLFARKPLKTLTVCAFTGVLLTGCGGGGGSTSSTAAKQQTVKVSISENTIETRQLNGEIDEASITAISGFDSPNISVSTKENILTITVGDLANSDTERFTLKTSASLTYTIVVDAENTSAREIVDQAETLTEITSPGTLAADDLRLMNIVLELEYLSGSISESEKVTTSQAAESDINDFATSLENEIALLNQALTNYESGDIPETDLKQRLSAASGALSDIGNAGESAIDNVTDTLTAMGIALPEDLEATNPLAYVEQADRFSRFMNANFGTFDSNGNFTFSNSYDFLNAVFHYASQ